MAKATFSPHTPSLHRRLLLGLGLGVGVALLLISLLAGSFLRSLALDFAATRLEHDLEALIAAVSVSDTGLQLAQSRLTLVYQQPYSGHYYRIESDAQEVLRSRSLWDTELALPRLPPGQAWQGELSGPEAQHLLVRAIGVKIAGRTLTVAVAEDISAFERGLTHFSLALLAGGLAALIGVLLLQSALVRAGLRPLRKLHAELDRLEHGEITTLPVTGVPREVRPLVERVNQLLDAQAIRIGRSRRALGNLAHALKTPLAVLGQVASSLAEQPTLRAELERQTMRLNQITEHELRRARLAGGSAVGRLDPIHEIEDLRQTLKRIYRDKSLACEFKAYGTWYWRGDREDFLELMGAVLDNAYKWARHRVVIVIEPGSIVVEEDGLGCAPEALSSLGRRGLRLDESQPGTGLGLSIAREIAEQYEGNIDLTPSALGGLKVCIRLPGLVQV